MCEYPGCTSEEVNEYQMCKDHQVIYSKNRDVQQKTHFDLQRIQDGLKKMAENAPAHIESENIFNSYKKKQPDVKPEDVQNNLF